MIAWYTPSRATASFPLGRRGPGRWGSESRSRGRGPVEPQAAGPRRGTDGHGLALSAPELGLLVVKLSVKCIAALWMEALITFR